VHIPGMLGCPGPLDPPQNGGTLLTLCKLFDEIREVN
jgi:hypothetical protein